MKDNFDQLNNSRNEIGFKYDIMAYIFFKNQIPVVGGLCIDRERGKNISA